MFNEEELELMIALLEQDKVQYDGIIKEYEQYMVHIYNNLIGKLKRLKKNVYGE